MTIEHFRKLYGYHFAINRQIWTDCIMHLSDEQFVQPLPYSLGSIRNQVVHIMDVDLGWFRGIETRSFSMSCDAADFPDRASVRQEWDKIEAEMQGVLDTMTDEQLEEDFFPGFKMWEMLFHALNHGTDHRGQILAMLFDLGAPTLGQGYFSYLRSIDPKLNIP